MLFVRKDSLGEVQSQSGHIRFTGGRGASGHMPRFLGVKPRSGVLISCTARAQTADKMAAKVLAKNGV